MVYNSQRGDPIVMPRHRTADRAPGFKVRYPDHAVVTTGNQNAAAAQIRRHDMKDHADVPGGELTSVGDVVEVGPADSQRTWDVDRGNVLCHVLRCLFPRAQLEIESTESQVMRAHPVARTEV